MYLTVLFFSDACTLHTACQFHCFSDSARDGLKHSKAD